MATHKAARLHKIKDAPIFEDAPKPEPAAGRLLVQVEGAAVNPVDRLRIDGLFGVPPLPTLTGSEGVGKVVAANGADLQHWVGKRVAFTGLDIGSWAEYATPEPVYCFEIGADVPLPSAASGAINPMTVIGFTETYEAFAGHKGLIHTAAASAVGRMLNKRCIDLGIPLLNIVRREEQAALLKKEGAKHVIITQGNWLEDYQKAIKDHGFNVLFDCLGGGDVTELLIKHLGPGSTVRIYGELANKPLTINNPLATLAQGTSIAAFFCYGWWVSLSTEQQKPIREKYSDWLKGQLSTTSYKVLNMSQIKDAIELSVTKATEGKVTVVPK